MEACITFFDVVQNGLKETKTLLETWIKFFIFNNFNHFLTNIPILHRVKTPKYLVFSGGIKWEQWS